MTIEAIKSYLLNLEEPAQRKWLDYIMIQKSLFLIVGKNVQILLREVQEELLI